MKSDAQLIEEAGTDPDAFAVLYERHVRALHAWLRARTGDSGVAMDLTAETFAQAALGLRRFRDEAEGSAVPWLHGIAANLLRVYYRRKRVETAARRKLGVPVERYESAFDEAEDRLDAEALSPALAAALDDLPEGQRRALNLRVVEGRAYDEVAAALGTSEVAARLHAERSSSGMHTTHWDAISTRRSAAGSRAAAADSEGPRRPR